MTITIKREDNKVRGLFKPLKTFRSVKSAETWLMEGMFSCEGSERDRYVSMLGQLYEGRAILNYDEL